MFNDLSLAEGSTDKKGRLAEERFLGLAVELIRDKSWVVSLTPASPVHDFQGVDAIITIELRNGDLCRVPVQVKSSESGVQHHLRRYKSHWVYRVVYSIVNDDVTDARVLARLEHDLLHVRLNNYTYDELLVEIESSQLPDHLEERYQSRPSIALP